MARVTSKTKAKANWERLKKETDIDSLGKEERKPKRIRRTAPKIDWEEQRKKYGPDAPGGSEWDAESIDKVIEETRWQPEGAHNNAVAENIAIRETEKAILGDDSADETPQKQTVNERYGYEGGGKLKLVTIKRAATWWAEKSRENPAIYGEFVYGYSAAPHHKEWLQMLLDPDHNRFLIVAPRESAKSTWMVILLAWSIGHFPLTSNFIGSVTLQQAQDRLQMVADLFQHNARHQLVFPDYVPDPKRGWRGNEINIRNRKMTYSSWVSMLSRFGSPKDATLFAAGSGSGSVIGRRFSGWGIIDDPHDEKNSATVIQRDKIFTWYQRTFVNCLQDSARSAVITTRWNEDDLAGRLMKIPSYKVVEVPAINYDGDIESSYWPEHWPLERLHAKREEIGDALFGALYMNDVYALSGDVFIIDWLRHDLPSPLPEFTDIVLSVDPALKKTTSADYTVAMTVGVDKHANYYVLDAKIGKWTPKEIAENVSFWADDIYTKYGIFPKVPLEAVAYQETLAYLISDVGVIPDNLVFPIKPNTDKVLRARIPAARTQAGRVFFDQSAPWIGQLQSQFCSFPKADHDDIVDAFTQAINFLDNGVQTKAKLHKVFIPGLN